MKSINLSDFTILTFCMYYLIATTFDQNINAITGWAIACIGWIKVIYLNFNYSNNGEY